MAAAIGAGLGIGLGGRLAELLGWRQVFLLYGGAGLVASSPWSSASPKRAVPQRTGTDRAAFYGRARAPGGSPPAPDVARRLHGNRARRSATRPGSRPTSSATAGSTSAQAGALFGGGALLGGIVGSLLGGMLADRRRRVRFAGEFDVSIASALIATPLDLPHHQQPLALDLRAGRARRLDRHLRFLSRPCKRSCWRWSRRSATASRRP